MLRTKKIVLLLLMVLPFMFSSVWAGKIKEPKIVKVNDMLVYENVAMSIYERLRNHNVAVNKTDSGDLIVPEDNLLLQDVNRLHREAQETVSTVSKDKIFWVFNKEKKIGIEFDSSKHLIVSIQLLQRK
jgi:hypothetical protein